LRHGQAKNNSERILAGRTKGVPLTELGLKQVQGITKFLKPLNISRIYSSPIERALNTAQIVGNELNLECKVDERLTELEMGKFTGINYDKIFAEHGNVFLKFYQENSTIAEHGVETFSNVKKRILDMVDFCTQNHNGENVLLVTHMDPIKAMVSTVMDLKPDYLCKLIIRNASLTIIKQEEGQFSISAINSMDADRYNLE